MTEQETAKELVKKFITITKVRKEIIDTDGVCRIVDLERKHTAKQCALICVDEMIDFIELCGDNFNWVYSDPKIQTPLEYWQEVKQEIELL